MNPLAPGVYSSRPGFNEGKEQFAASGINRGTVKANANGVFVILNHSYF